MSASPEVVKSDISSPQVRAGRALVAWSQDELAAASGVNKRTIARLELGQGVAFGRTLAAIRTALEAAGVEFTNGDAPGVRLRGPFKSG